ncbi:putative nucleotidyltransferase substrate binding domain-containing protein [Lapillicoccus sp.]|uniref:putative nucleotidyltransferase substrate binding domain-containing protein n=1 Tax=Lapillicoccus sp. TaxID=1909287 RepID=UPI003262FE4F
MTSVETTELSAVLVSSPPFDSLSPAALTAITNAAVLQRFSRGDLILDAFTDATVEVFVVLSGVVELWNSVEAIREAPDERLESGGVFGFSAMLTERSVGPRAVAASDATVARIPAVVAAPAFGSRRGARFLAETLSSAGARTMSSASYSLVDDLIVQAPFVVQPTTPVGDVARRMTDHNSSYAAVRLGPGRFGLVTDALLRRHVLVEGVLASAAASTVMQSKASTVVLGDSAAEALILMFDREADYLLVTDRAGELRGVITPRDFMVSSSTAGVSLNEQVRRATTIEELHSRAGRAPAMLGDLLSQGLASGKVIAVYSAVVDAVVRRAISLVFERRPELSVDAFTWLSLGSNGRREALLTSDVDSAVAFDDSVSAQEIDRYRAAFAEVDEVLARAGLRSDEHGARAQQQLFARTNSDWRAAGEQWLSAPADNNGAMMTSLLVDGRPILGDPGLPAVAEVFGELRRHPGTLRMLLEESLSSRARLRSMRDVLRRRPDFDLKKHALLPIVNIGRWAALSVGSHALPTVERLRVAAGSAMLPDDQATTLVEVFELLQRLRLRYQLLQRENGDDPSDVFVMDRMSPMDRTVVSEAVREIASIQRRMANVSNYVPAVEWSARSGPDSLSV